MPRSSSKVAAVWILPDQLVVDHPALARAADDVGQSNVRVVLIESQASLRRRPYHKKRQALILSAGRHFVEELRAEGWNVEMIRADETLQGLQRFLGTRKFLSVFTMQSTDYAIRQWQEHDLARETGIQAIVLPNSMFLVERGPQAQELRSSRKIILEYFYRYMRRYFGVLMEADGEPTGGRWNYDAENRQPMRSNVEVPPLPRFEPDSITQRVLDEVEASQHGVGILEDFDLAVTRSHAELAFEDFLAHRLPQFGPFEDAMSRQHATLFHSVLSPYMNLGLLEPLAMIRAAEARYRTQNAPINSVEGFVRQILGWREFIYWQYHRQMPELLTANAWKAMRRLPDFFWTGDTEMTCLKTVVERLLKDGYTHHIERLMLVCNYCLLAGIDPREVADWFLTMYVDSHEWVVLPNVIGMGLNADGGKTATKPYIASANYIHKMGDYCKTCRYEPRIRTGPNACPFNTLYWNFLIQHEQSLRSNPRLGPNVLGLKHIKPGERFLIQAEASAILGSDAE